MVKSSPYQSILRLFDLTSDADKTPKLLMIHAFQGTMMGIFGRIFRKIFSSSHSAIAPAVFAAPTVLGSSQKTSFAIIAVDTDTTAAISPVDVEKMLDDMAATFPDKLNWRISVVDLMTLLDLDSSLSARKVLAHELHYKGNVNDSASRNLWLHRQLINRLAANGGKVPAELKD